jgi:hypothetical protein
MFEHGLNGGSDHVNTSLFFFSSAGAPMSGGMPPAMGAPGAPGVAGAPPNPANGYNQHPGAPIQGIDPAVEISRITNNIYMYNLMIALSAVGACMSTCLFVKSIYKPAKGVHGGDSDADMDSDEEDDDDESDD